MAMLLLALMVVAAAAASSDSAQPGPAAATNGVLCVNNTVGGPGTGACWTDPYKYLQDALAAASSGDEIWVAGWTGGGTVLYYPDEGAAAPDNAITATFQLTDGLAIYGGFAGTETSRGQRDWMTYVTVLSGDIDQNDSITDPRGIVTDPAGIAGGNSYHVVTGSGVTTTAVLDGFVITAGSAIATTDPNDLGGGMLNDNGSPVLSNLVFMGNQARHGGGMVTQGSDPTVTNVLFSGNLAGRGGGMANLGGDPC